jgi:hypothetical protein
MSLGAINYFQSLRYEVENIKIGECEKISPSLTYCLQFFALSSADLFDTVRSGGIE